MRADIGPDVWQRIQEYENTKVDDQKAAQIWGRYQHRVRTALPRSLEFGPLMKYYLK